jgi:WD40 repeat protein
VKHPSPGIWLWLLTALLTAQIALAAPVGNAQAREALTVLKAECFTCHGEDKKKGGLSLTSREAMLKGGDEGPVVQAGKPDASRLLTFLRADADPHMPPKKQLEPAQIKSVRDWIKGGLVWDASALSDDATPLKPVALAPLPPSYQPVLTLALSPDGKRLAIGRGGRLVLHDLAQTNFPIIAQVEAHRDAVQSLSWSHDGRRLASGGFRRVVVWDGGSLHQEREVTNGLSGRVTALEFTPDDTTLALADGESGRSGFVRLLNTTNGHLTASWRAHADTVFDLEFSRDGTRLLTAGGDRLVKVWDVATRKETAALEGHTAQVLAAAFNTNATQVVSGGADKQLKVWDIATKEKIITLGSHTAALTSIAWPGDGAAIFAVTDAGGVFRYTNLKSHTGEQSSATGDERRLGETVEAALCVATSADGKLVCVGSHDGSVHLWDQDGKLLAKLSPTPPPELATTAKPMEQASDPAPRKPAGWKSAGPGRLEAYPPKLSNSANRALPVNLKPSSAVALTAEPAELRLSADSPRQTVLITARTADGFEVDVTDVVKFSAGRRAPFRLGDLGEIVAETAGTGVLTARFGRLELAIPVTVQGDASAGTTAGLTPAPPSFVRDVLPALNQAGCSAGSCHAKPEGQNGFKLSVFSYDPRADHAAIVKGARGRRVFPAAPDESLLLLKPLGLVPHEGGQRFARGSETHQLVRCWLRGGMAYSLTNEPMLQRVTAFPKERRYRKGATQRLLVLAHYSDGSVRDVTRLAAFDSNDKEVAKVDERGRITIGTLTGQGVVVARYMGFVGDAQILVPAEHLLPAERYAALPKNNFIDELAHAQFQRLGLFPSDLCTDAEFLRRAKLDAIGLLPTETEVRAFLADASPDKRQRFIAQVLNDPAYADYWANKWADLLRPNPDRVGVKSVFLLDQWLRERFRQNQPYDQFVREILLAEGSNHREGPAVIYRDRREPPELTTMFSQLFLGTRLECAKCHHHPNEKWSQDDFYQLAAFFGPVKQKGAGLSPPISAGTETFYFAPGGSVKHPVTGAVMAPKPPDGPLAPIGADDPRRALADWLTAPGNPFFARAAVNRVWANFFGRGLVQPVDDFRISNPSVNPALLDALAADFAAHGHDLKHLMQTILSSRLYQLSTAPNDSNLADTRNFSRAYRRRLPAEVLLDAVNDATGVPDAFAALPAGGRATQAWSYKIESHFMDAFGRPNSSSDCPCERDQQLSVVQSLHLMNSKNLQAKLSAPTGRVHQLAASNKSPADVVSTLYLTTLNRPPTTEELRLTTAAFSAPGVTRQTAIEDIFWALLNSPEFVFNH